jgi:hypothetical protein
MRSQSLFQRAAITRAIACLTLAAASAGASAQVTPPAQFTFTPAGVGLTGAPVTSDNIIVSDFSTVTFTGADTFSDSGLLSITGFQLGGSNVVADGLNGTYSLYFQFTATGHLTTGTSATDPRTGLTAGVFDTLDYSLIGADGNASFGFSGNTPTVTPGGPTQTLATGSLVNGNVVTTPANGGTAFVPSAAATLSFAVSAGMEPFFSPIPFPGVAFTAFTNAVSTVEPFGTGDGSGFRINNGGGNINFAAAPIPEPETYALMLAGLAAVATIARRRTRRD